MSTSKVDKSLRMSESDGAGAEQTRHDIDTMTETPGESEEPEAQDEAASKIKERQDRFNALRAKAVSQTILLFDGPFYISWMLMGLI
jgi:hypothetical protein